MNRKLAEIMLIPAFFGCLLAAGTAAADSKQVQLNIRAEVKNLSKLEIDSTTVSFEVGTLSPDDAPVISSSPAQINISSKARTAGSSNVTLMIQASGDLVSGSDVISSNNISWISTGPGYIAGMVDKVSPRLVASWVGSGIRSGTISFKLTNRWEYPRGDYSTTAIFTLTAP